MLLERGITEYGAPALTFGDLEVLRYADGGD